MDDQNKNLILATVLSFLVIIGWMILFPPPEPVVDPNATPAAQSQAENSNVLPPAGGEATSSGNTDLVAVNPTAAALAQVERINIETPELSGSVSLLGGRIDDLSLKSYNETLDADSKIVTLLNPVGEENAYYALYGWASTGTVPADQLPGANTVWALESGADLTPETPVTLVWDNGAGLIFKRQISIDDKFLFDITQTVENKTDQPIDLRPYSYIARHGEPDTIGFFILHEGVVQLVDGELTELDYSDMPDLTLDPRNGTNSETARQLEDGWIGFTDKNWMTTLIPEQGRAATSISKYSAAQDVYQTEMWLDAVAIAPGATVDVSSRLFAGAKEWETIRAYERAGVTKFIESIDWGWFSFLTKPIFAVLHWLNTIIGNMGWSIIALTLLIKALLFPLAYKSYVSMAKMKELQPEMEKLKERVGDDRQKMQVEMMALYKKEKVNPAAGCLPILLQIPIFFSLYKVIFVTIELRHAPWLGWIRDLSAPDPSSILNLFGLLPYATPEPGSLFFIFSLGVMPIILGVSMWLQQKLNPAPTDPTQAMIFAWMPWVFMFMLGSFASGLVLYWIANNVITFTQQYVIMRSQGYKPDIFGNIMSSFKKSPKDEA